MKKEMAQLILEKLEDISLPAHECAFSATAAGNWHLGVDIAKVADGIDAVIEVITSELRGHE